MRSLSVRPIGCTAARMGRRREGGGREEDGPQVEGETREGRGEEGEKIGIATRERQQVRRAAYRNFRLKIALTQKLRCYFWKSAERGGRDRPKEADKTAVGGWSVRPTVLRSPRLFA